MVVLAIEYCQSSGEIQHVKVKDSFNDEKAFNKDMSI